MTINFFKRVVRNFDRRGYIAYNENEIWQVDLADYSKSNDNKKFILVCVDVFTRKMYAKTMKTKSEAEINEKLSEIFNEHGKPEKIHSDEESGLKSSKLLKDNGIEIYHTYNNDFGAGIVERAIRTLKLKIAQNKEGIVGKKWTRVFNKSVDEYNEGKNRNMGRSPNEAQKEQGDVMRNLWIEKFKEPRDEIKKKLKVGDYVVIALKRDVLRKESKKQWGDKVYEVSKIMELNPTMYELMSLQGEEVAGRFYYQQLQKIERSDIPKKQLR